jgi:hypothetical protein
MFLKWKELNVSMGSLRPPFLLLQKCLGFMNVS